MFPNQKWWSQNVYLSKGKKYYFPRSKSQLKNNEPNPIRSQSGHSSNRNTEIVEPSP